MRLPVLPTLTVALGVPFLIYLGLWQLDRREEKAELIGRIEVARQRSPGYLNEFRWPVNNVNLIRVVADCRFDPKPGTVSGGSGADGRGGYVYEFLCLDPDAKSGLRHLAWVRGGVSSSPNLKLRPPQGVIRVRGVLLDGGEGSIAGPPIPQFTIILDRALVPQLRPAYQPTVASLPNNHLLYAIQWFAFAATLGIIYALWLRRWLRERR